MKTVVVIPARYASTRFPGKPLALIRGVPVIEHVWRKAVESRSAERIIVATDDKRIYEAVTGFGGECYMTSPEHRSGSDRIGEVADRIEADVIVNVQGDEPFINPEVIDTVVHAMEGENPPDISTAAVPIMSEGEYRDPDVVKVVTDGDGNALYFSRSPIPHGWKDGQCSPMRHLGLYAYSREALLRFVSLSPGRLEQAESLEQLRALENGMRIVVVRVDIAGEGIGIDRPEDVDRAERTMSRLENLTEGGTSAGNGEKQ
jgi:3-deoxy-manno-octulosonate cytidylyltransferase (CMP-KDO synthetase)